MSLRTRKPSDRRENGLVPSWVSNNNPSLFREAAEVNASYWQRRERVRQQPLPRLQLYAFDTTQANDELYAFLYDRKEVRHFYSQSRLNGQRMGELEAVEGYGRADIMAMAWTRKGGADFEIVFYGHNNVNLAEGYVIKSDVNGKLSWVVKITRLYSEHVMALTSRTLFSLPVYTALASGLKFGLDDPRGGFGTLEISSNAVDDELVKSMSALGYNVDISPKKMPTFKATAGRGEIGGYFSEKQTFEQSKGVPPQGGDMWCVIRPWDNNYSIGSVASFESFMPMTPSTALKPKRGIRCVPQVKDGPVGAVFPTRGEPITEQGQFVHRIDIEETPIDDAIGVKPSHAMHMYRAYLHNNTVGGIIGVIDIIPDVQKNADNTMSSSRLIGTPTVGKDWIGQTAEESVTIDQSDVDRCVKGDICPWSMDLVCVIEAGIYKLVTEA